MIQTTFSARIKQENGILFPEVAETIDEICRNAGIVQDTRVNVVIRGNHGQDPALFRGYVFNMLPHTGCNKLEIGYRPPLAERLAYYGYIKDDPVTVTISTSYS